jgi:hypothetical protein
VEVGAAARTPTLCTRRTGAPLPPWMPSTSTTTCSAECPSGELFCFPYLEPNRHRLLHRPHRRSPQQPGTLGEHAVSFSLLCVSAAVPWRRNGPSPRGRDEPVAACFAPPPKRRRLCADHRVEPYACRCRCRRPRVHPARPPLFVLVVVRSPRYVESTNRPRPCREHRPPCARLHVHKPNRVLTQKVHSAPITQQAGKLASHAQRANDVPVNFS